MPTVNEIEHGLEIERAKGPVRFVNRNILRSGVSTGWVNRAKGKEGFTKCTVCVICIDPETNECVTPNRGVLRQNLKFTSRETENARGESFACAVIDQQECIALEMVKFSRMLCRGELHFIKFTTLQGGP